MIVNNRHSHRTTVRKGAVPLGQHNHSPETVLGTAPLPVRVSSLPGPPVDMPRVHPPTGVYSNLPAPAPREAGCSCCERTAALVDPATGKGYCSGCWVTCVIHNQLD